MKLKGTLSANAIKLFVKDLLPRLRKFTAGCDLVFGEHDLKFLHQASITDQTSAGLLIFLRLGSDFVFENLVCSSLSQNLIGCFASIDHLLSALSPCIDSLQDQVSMKLINHVWTAANNQQHKSPAIQISMEGMGATSKGVILLDSLYSGEQVEHIEQTIGRLKVCTFYLDIFAQLTVISGWVDKLKGLEGDQIGIIIRKSGELFLRVCNDGLTAGADIGILKVIPASVSLGIPPLLSDQAEERYRQAAYEISGTSLEVTVSSKLLSKCFSCLIGFSFQPYAIMMGISEDKNFLQLVPFFRDGMEQSVSQEANPGDPSVEMSFYLSAIVG
eukprot:TRINITY_DN2588_c0_g3_i3.p1 TRINITY_DN2588_c0_g3~~TRINITY_DN2588_c0_g3_i3.p1  ORF type:complete len:330 (-),score=49.82 TRINITY_DN2588_c0_g3_i3:692-1681(-)